VASAPVCFTPGDKYPSVSVTGRRCELMCDFCRGAYLKGMVPVRGPDELYQTAARVWERGGKGLLVSGGFDRHGRLPLRPYLGAIRRIKEDFDLVLSVHPGFLSRELLRELKRAGVDVIDYFLAVNPSLLRAMHLDLTPSDVARHFEACLEVGFEHVAPHVMVGFGGVVSEWDYRALSLASARRPYLVVVLVFIPTRGTPAGLMPPPSVGEVLEFMECAREALSGSEVALGCMRPPWLKPVLDELVVRRGLVDRLAAPRPSLVERHGLTVIDACCSIPPSYI